jgi:AsmA protein
VSSQLTLDNGLVTLNRLQGQSDVMAMTGEGQLDLCARTLVLRSTACCTSCWKLSPSVRVSVIWSCAWPCQ